MVLLMKMDHSLSDGIGMLSFLMAIADNYDISMFPQLKTPSIWQSFILNLLSPYYMIKSLAIDLNMKVQENIFKRTTGPIIGKRIIKIGKKYIFTQVSKLAKSLGLTFNEFITAVVSKATKAYLKKEDPKNNLDSISISAPVSTRTMPKCLEDYTIDNSMTTLSYDLPLIDDIKTEKSKIKTALSSLKDFFLVYGYLLKYSVVSSFLPVSYLKEGGVEFATKVSLVFSNVPGPKTQLIYANTKINTMIPTPNPGFFHNFLAIITYNDEFNLTFATDSNIRINAHDYIKAIEKEMDLMI